MEAVLLALEVILQIRRLRSPDVILRGSWWPFTPLLHNGQLDNDTKCVRPNYPLIRLASYCLKWNILWRKLSLKYVIRTDMGQTLFIQETFQRGRSVYCTVYTLQIVQRFVYKVTWSTFMLQSSLKKLVSKYFAYIWF